MSKVIVIAQTMRGRKFVINPKPNTIDHVAKVMEVITCGNAKNARYFLKTMGSYTADSRNRTGIRYRAEVVGNG